MIIRIEHTCSYIIDYIELSSKKRINATKEWSYINIQLYMIICVISSVNRKHRMQNVNSCFVNNVYGCKCQRSTFT